MTDPIRLAAVKADTILIETARVEGALRVIADVAGVAAAKIAAEAALNRVLIANDHSGDWVR